MENLFISKKGSSPLADRIRPNTLEEFVGQRHLVGENGPIRKAIESGVIPSMIFWGPPGTGKTTLARILGNTPGYRFKSFSAVLSGVKEVREVINEAKFLHREGKKTLLFIDEIHRFNKAQQDAFLPHVENGTIVLIGATTENPSFEVISPLLSRCIVYVFNKLSPDELKIILERAINTMSDKKPDVLDDVKEYIINIADGDARVAINLIEFAVNTTEPKNGIRKITKEKIHELVKHAPLLYDKKGEEHYNLVSAFIKSLRGSDPDAALYWLARMLEGGEDPLFIARRMVIFASEDIGNADPQALVLATSCKEAVHFVGMPEGFLPLAQTAIYLACAPKSNSAYVAYKRALEDVRRKGALPVPFHLRNPVTGLMDKFGYGKGYKYPHDYPGHYVEENYFPKELGKRKYFAPTEQGFEKIIKKWIEERKKSP